MVPHGDTLTQNMPSMFRQGKVILKALRNNSKMTCDYSNGTDDAAIVKEKEVEAVNYL